MDNKLKQWFSSIFLDLFQSQVKHYLMSFTDRLIPTFSQLGRECEEFEHRESQRMRCLVDPEIDYGDFAQLIHDRTIDYYISLSNIRQGLINLLTAGLYHLFEQQVSRFVATSPNKSISKTELFDRFEKILGYWNCTTSSLPHWDILTNELRLVANTVKHGPGGSANNLADLRPDPFLPDHMKTEGAFKTRGDFATSPVAGEGLFLTTDDFRIYSSATIEFWNAFSWRDE